MLTAPTTPAVTTESRHFTASAVVIDIAARLVLLVDHKASGQRQFPGEHVDPDETGDEAAIREVWEETGVHAQLWHSTGLVVPGGRVHPTPFMVVEFPAPAKPHKGEPEHHHIDLLYLATADSVAPINRQVAEVDGVAWLEIEDLHNARVRPDVPVVTGMAWNVMSRRR